MNSVPAATARMRRNSNRLVNCLGFARIGRRRAASLRSGAQWGAILAIALACAAPAWSEEGRFQTSQATVSSRRSVGHRRNTLVRADRVMQVQALGEEEDSDRQAEMDDPRRPAPDPDLNDIPIPEYPLDPAWPTWTPNNYLSRQPVFAPAGRYELIRPPTGFSPTEYGQEYERVVASEADLFYHEATCPPPIDMYTRPDGMAPAGVFGDHTLNTGGKILMSYRFNTMSFSGLRTGTHEVSTASVLQQFPLAPTHATAQTHYFTFEYGPTDDVTFLVTLPIILRKINYVDAAGLQQLTDITDLYDISAYMNYVLYRWDRQQIHANLGVRIPTGIFDELSQPLPTPDSPNLTYPMRTSDGTYDFLPGLTYRGQSNAWTWGAQGLGTVRFGLNRFGYRLGDDATLNLWLSRKVTDAVSLSSRLNWQWWGNIFGADDRLNPNLVPTNRTNLQAGQRLEILFGLNYLVPAGFLQGQRLGVEGGIPIFQDLSGPQLQQSYDLWANLTMIF